MSEKSLILDFISSTGCLIGRGIEQQLDGPVSLTAAGELEQLVAPVKMAATQNLKKLGA
jgi:hypothetical protein